MKTNLTESQFKDLKDKLSSLDKKATKLSESMMLGDHLVLVKITPDGAVEDPIFYIVDNPDAGEAIQTVEDHYRAIRADEEEAAREIEETEIDIEPFIFLG